MLTARDGRRDRRLHDARQGRHGAPRGLHQRRQRAGPGEGRASRLGLGGPASLPGRDQDRGLGPAGPAPRYRDRGRREPRQHVLARGARLRRQDRGGLDDGGDRLARAALAPNGEARRCQGRAYRRPRSLMTVRVEATEDRQFRTNSYLVEDDETRDGVVIDANLEPESMIDLVRKRKANVRAILLTHTDVDHVGGLSALLDAFGPIPVAVHAAERHVVKEGRPLRRDFGAATHPTYNLFDPLCVVTL